MKIIRLLSFILLFLLTFSACGGDLPTLAETETEDHIQNDTETESESESESESGTEAPIKTDTETETSAEKETEAKTPKKRVAITYDDGPAFDNDTVQRVTYQLVDLFAKYDGAATFFVVGNRINAQTGKAMQYAHEHGFEYAIHDYTHEIYFDTCDEQAYLNELRQTKEAIQKYIDADVTLLRAPGGRMTPERAILGGYPIINWSLDTEDWRYKSRADDVVKENINTIVENALRNVEDGDIILMHEIYMNTLEATSVILANLHAMGFEFVTVSELFGEGNLEVGKTYYRAPPIE